MIGGEVVGIGALFTTADRICDPALIPGNKE